MSLQACKVIWVDRQSAAGGNHRSRSARKFVDYFFLKSAKHFFAVGFENVRDGLACLCLDHLVRVEIFKMQLLPHEPAHGSSVRSHEPTYRDIHDHSDDHVV